MDQKYSPKCNFVADVYYVVRATMAVSVLNMYRLFPLSLLPKQYSVTIYVVFTLY